MNERIVIVGATSAIAEQCARLWITKEPEELLLVGRNLKGLERVSSDLKVRNPKTRITVKVTNLLDTQSIKNSVDEICASGPPDIVLIAHGSLPNQSKCQYDVSLVQQTLEINGLSSVIWAESFAARMEIATRGTLAVIGSVAGDRARKSNYVYGSAKAMVASYIGGLQHRFAGTGVNIVLIKPGPTDTPMTRDMKKTGLKLASVETVANNIVKGIESGKQVIYVPSKWQLIMIIIRAVPQVVFNKLDI